MDTHLPNAVKLGFIRNTYGTHPRTWTFEGRLGDEGDWNIIHTVTDDLMCVETILYQRRIKAYDQYRWVLRSKVQLTFILARNVLIYHTCEVYD